MRVLGFFTVFNLALTICLVQSSKCLWKMTILPNINPFQIGDVLNLTCTYVGNNTPSSTAVILDQNGEVLPSTWITPRATMTTREISTCFQFGTYCCQSEYCRRSLINCRTIDVEDLSKKPSLQCIYNNYIDVQANINCQWQPACPGNRFMWNLQYKNSIDSRFRECPMVSRFSTSCAMPAIDFIVTNYTLKLHLIGRHENRTYDYNISADDTILRMDVRMENTVAVSSTQLNISLRLSNTKENMLCQLFYESEWESEIKKANFSLSYLPLLTVLLVLEDLEPFTIYSIYARCKPSESLYWSPATQTHSARTLPAVPTLIPRNIRFSDNVDPSGQRHIYLYWLPIPKRSRGGEFTEYTVTYNDQAIHNKTDVYPGNSVTAVLKTQFLTKSGIRLVIGSRNEVGTGPKTTVVIVPPFNEANLQPVVNVGQDKSNINVFWKGHVLQSGQRSLTYYWCDCPKRMVHLPQCEAFPDSITTNSSEVTIAANIQSKSRRYFGVSSEDSDLPSGRRIIWSNCVFTDSMSVEVEPMLLTASRFNSSTIKVNLQRDFCEFDIMPWLYKVRVESIEVNCSQLDDEEYNNFTAVPDIKELYVQSTKQKATICFQVSFTNGHIEDSSFAMITHSASDSKDDMLVNPLITGCASAAAVIFVICLFLSCSRYKQRLRNTTKIADVDIWPSKIQEYHAVYFKTLNDSMTKNSSDGDSVMTQSSTVSTLNGSDMSTGTVNDVTADYYNKNCGKNVSGPHFQNDAFQQSQPSCDNPNIYSRFRVGAIHGNREDTQHSMSSYVQQSLREDSYQHVSTDIIETSGINLQSDLLSTIINSSIPEDDITSYSQINIHANTSTSAYVSDTDYSVSSYTLATYSGDTIQIRQMNDLPHLSLRPMQTLSQSSDSILPTQSTFSVDDYVIGTRL